MVWSTPKNLSDALVLDWGGGPSSAKKKGSRSDHRANNFLLACKQCDLLPTKSEGEIGQKGPGILFTGSDIVRARSYSRNNKSMEARAYTMTQGSHGVRSSR